MHIDLKGVWQLSLGKNIYTPDSVEEAFHPTLKEEVAYHTQAASKLVNIKALPFEETIELPSTTEISRKGNTRYDDRQKLHLNRNYPFTGKAYYKRQVSITEDFIGQGLKLILERTKFTRVFWDGECVSLSHETLIPQVHYITSYLTAGEHELIIEVDNDLKSYEDFPYSLYSGHQYTDHTQTNWNGILGEIYLETVSSLEIKAVQVKKGMDWNEVHIDMMIESKGEFKETTLYIAIGEEVFELKKLVAIGNNHYTFTLTLQEVLKSWDEFEPSLYPIELTLYTEGIKQTSYQLRTGFYEVQLVDKGIWLNNQRIFLRGNIDCAIFPLTGAAPMSKMEWHRLFKILQDYGMNHCRFHSWCPPEAAFEVADELGIYLQVELSCFANGLYECNHPQYDATLNYYLYDQASKVLKHYGNHPSFFLFAIGNEMVGDLTAFDKLLSHLKALRSDKLYSQGANNFLETPQSCKEDDFWVIMRTTKEGNNIRGSFSYGDLPLGHIQTQDRIGTMVDYEEALTHSSLPLIAHEVGQYQIFPCLEEEAAYTGVTSSTVLNQCRQKLAEKKMLSEADAFFKASGQLAIQCYKEDLEALLRTKGMSGFQLLSLQDYPGQGMALIGIMDSFWKSKELITPKTWRTFCNDRVLFAQMPSYTYTIGETITINIGICHYGKTDIIHKTLTIKLIQGDRILEEVGIPNLTVQRGGVRQLTTINLQTIHLIGPLQCELVLEYDDLTNHYPIWLYPQQVIEADENVYITSVRDEKVEKALLKGKNVLLFSSALTPSIEAGFTPDFWCYPMFKSACEEKGLKVAPGTMGLLIDHKHPALAHFPTESYASWQWQQIVTKSCPVILDEYQEDYTLIAQVIDNFERCHKLGLIYEQQVHRGKLVTCTLDILSYIEIPEIRQLYNSLVIYMNHL